jgi:hypothetical protein
VRPCNLIDPNLVELNYTRLTKRWNLEHSQAKIWLFAGVGTIQGNDFFGSRFSLHFPISDCPHPDRDGGLFICRNQR